MPSSAGRSARGSSAAGNGSICAPIAGAVAPGLAFAQAIGRWGNWFNQQRYGHPTTLPWAVEISPEHRLAGYLNFATFQPVFLYESVWDVLVGVLVIYAARRFMLTGDRTFAVYAGLYAIGRFWTEGMQLSYSPYQFGLRVDQVVMVLALIGAAAYLYLTRHRRGPDFIAPADDDTGPIARVGASARAHGHDDGPDPVAETAGADDTAAGDQIDLPTAPMIWAGFAEMRSASVPPQNPRAAESPQYFGPTNSSSLATASRRATEMVVGFENRQATPSRSSASPHNR